MYISTVLEKAYSTLYMEIGKYNQLIESESNDTIMK